MTEQFLVEIFVKTFLSVIEIIILLAVIIKVLRLEALLTPRSVEAYSPLFSLPGPHQTPQPYLALAYLMLLGRLKMMMMMMKMMRDCTYL